VVSFPNGDKKRHTGAANASGTLSWTYTQPGSRISRSSRTARVQVTASEGTLIKSSTKRYTIAFAAVDVWVQPRTLKAGKALAIWVHSTAFAVILVRLQYSGGPTVVFTAQAGADGWMYRSYTVPSASHKGRVTVKAYRQSPRGFGETSFRVT
jgi:hypothetical protein